MQWIPGFLVLSRAVVAPLLLWDASHGQAGLIFIALYLWAFGSDILDGIIARRLQVSTARLRVADSLADTLLYISLAICTWLTHPDVVLANQVPLKITIGAMMVWVVINLLKYGKLASYHTYSAKIWGITLCLATLGIYTDWQGTTLLTLACVCGCVNIAEEILITLVLPTWHHDVLSLIHARKLRLLSP